MPPKAAAVKTTGAKRAAPLQPAAIDHWTTVFASIAARVSAATVITAVKQTSTTTSTTTKKAKTLKVADADVVGELLKRLLNNCREFIAEHAETREKTTSIPTCEDAFVAAAVTLCGKCTIPEDSRELCVWYVYNILNNIMSEFYGPFTRGKTSISASEVYDIVMAYHAKTVMKYRDDPKYSAAADNAVGEMTAYLSSIKKVAKQKVDENGVPIPRVPRGKGKGKGAAKSASAPAPPQPTEGEDDPYANQDDTSGKEPVDEPAPETGGRRIISRGVRPINPI
jgi:hypothetical protein